MIQSPLFKKLKEAKLQDLIFNAGWLFFDKILRLGVGLFVSVWVARYLGPEQYGLINNAQAFVALFAGLATLGLDAIVIRNIVSNVNEKDDILGTTFVLKLTGGAILFLLSWILITILYPDNIQMRMFVGILAIGTIFQAFDTIDFWFQSQVRSKYTVYAKDIAFLLISIVKIYLILNEEPLITFVIASVVEIIVGAVGLVVVYRINNYSLLNWKLRLGQAKKLLKESWPLILSTTLIMLYMKIDQIMIGKLLGHESVGIYTAATRITEIFYFISTIILSTMLPSIVRAKMTNNELYFKKYTTIIQLLVVISYLLVLLIVFFSDMIINSLYGEHYAEAGPVLTIYIVAIIFVFLQNISGSWFVNENMQIQAFIRNLFGAIANIILNFILIPYMGIYGASIATIVSYIIVLISPVIFVKEYRKLFLIMLNSMLLRNIKHFR